MEGMPTIPGKDPEIMTPGEIAIAKRREKLNDLLQHGARKTASYEGSVLMGDIAHKSTEALRIVEMVTLDGHTYEVAPEFDEVFSKMAVA